MKILLVYPPQIPSYFNAGHHLPLFVVGAYLRGCEGVTEVRCVDAGILNYHWKAIGDLVFQGQYDFIAVMNDFDAIDGFSRFVRYARELSPKSRILTFGRLSRQIPDFFTRYDIDAVVVDGDDESAVESFVHLVSGRDQSARGLLVRRDGAWTRGEAGVRLSPEQWVLPDVREIPYAAIESLYRDDQNKFCGIPGRRELVVPVARGCPVGCHFCDVPAMQGLSERRLSVDAVVSYIQRSFQTLDFEYVAFYGPVFTLKRDWVLELCACFEALPRRIPWKCATTLYHLDEELVRRMAEAGCVRISTGVETLEPSALQALPKIKKETEARLRAVSGWCRQYGIELNGFIVLGLPGESAEGPARTVRVMRELGVRVRATMYTPYENMRPDMSEEEIRSFNRQFPHNGLPYLENKERFKILFDVDPNLTQVMHQIPKAGSV